MASASFNRVILVGNLTRDPELRYTPTGTPVCDVGLAISDRYKNANGEWVDETTFVDVTLWSRTAEVASEYLSKGASVLIEGRLKLDTWEANDGQKRSKLRVVCQRMQMLGGKAVAEGTGEASGRPGPRAQSPAQYSQPVPSHDEFETPPPDVPPADDIPF